LDGYRAIGVSKEKSYSIKPEAIEIIDEKLYLDFQREYTVYGFKRSGLDCRWRSILVMN
jgi:hypothetical protein